jgi:hypothetical protein
MNDAELRALFPTQIIRGALLRPDGVAVGLVTGGAPTWDLLAQEARGQVGIDYHRLLLALDTPIAMYVVDQPPDLAEELATLHERQRRAAHPLLADVLDATAGYLNELAQSSGSRAKQVFWTITAGDGIASPATVRSIGGLDLAALLQRGSGARVTRSSPMGRAALTQAVERARRLADALGQLGGTPQARLMEAEEIARLLYQLADPVRASRYPLAGTVLDRVRRVVGSIEWGLA